MVRAEAIESLLYGCSTGTLRRNHYAKLHTVHHRVLLRIIGAQCKRPDHRMTSYSRALEITRCECIETKLRMRSFLWAGALIRLSGGRLPKRVVFGKLEGAVRRKRGGKEKERTDCVQSDIRAFDIAGDWKATALEAEEWAKTFTEGGWIFVAAWRKEEVDAARRARRRDRQRDWKSCYRTPKRKFFRSDIHWPGRRVEETFVRTRDGPRPSWCLSM